MRKLWIFALFSALVVAGCSGGNRQAQSEATGSSTPATTGEATKPDGSGEFKVALLTPGPVTDQGWSAMAYDGLKEIETELKATVNNQEAQGTQIREAMRTYAREGYKLIFGHGFEYNAPAMEVAKEFPNTVFISSSGAETAANVGAFRFYLEQGFYLAGMTAALMSKTGKLAMIGGDEVPSIKSTFKAFEAGAKAAKPGIVVTTTFTGSGQDVAKAKLATLQAISNGADMIIHQANAAAAGVFEACKEKKVMAFGANLDQNSDPSNSVLASAVIVAKPAFVALAKKVKEGSYQGQIELMGMKEGAIDFVWNPAMVNSIPADVRSQVEKAKADILSGALVVPKDEF